jgi:hypothetical protein
MLGAVIVALVLFAGFPRGGWAQSDGFPSLTPDSRAAEFARLGDGASWEDLAEMALWASALGTDTGPTFRGYMNTLRQAVEELGTGLRGGARDRGDYILSYMHRKFLRSYSVRQTRLDTLLSNGRYNCVSSAALYLILARSQGLEARGVATRDHAFVTLGQGDESWDVETTNLYGFDPGSRREFHDQFGKLTGFAYVPARNYRDRIELSPLELISLIIHNRIVDLEQQGRYAQAVPLAVNRASLLAERRSPAVSDFFADPGQDLRERILNYGASLLNAGREEEGLRWAVYAGPAFTGAAGPDDSRWQNYISTLVSNRTIKLCRAGRFAEARGFLADNGFRIDPAKHRELGAMITDAEFTGLVNGVKQAADALNLIARLDEAESAGLLPVSRARELRDYLSLWLATDFHNRFAAAFNRRDYTLARTVLDEGLAAFPDNRRLLGDRDTLERALAPR